MSHGSDMSNTLRSPTQPRLPFNSFIQGLSEPQFTDSPATYPASVALLSHGGRFHSSFTQESFMILKPEPRGHHCGFNHLLGTEPGPLNDTIWGHFSLLLRFRNRTFLRPPLCARWKLSCQRFCPEGTTHFISFQSRPFFNLISFSTSLGSNIKFPSALFHFKQ